MRTLLAVALAALGVGCLVPPPEDVVDGKPCDQDAGHGCAPGYLCCRGSCAGEAEGCCQPETDAAFCARLGKTCDPVSGADSCGAPRSVNCGTCAGPATCGGGGVQNVCGVPGCTPETNAAFCARYGKQCGNFTNLDNCGTTRTAGCGSCATQPNLTCSASNTCVCTPETDAAFCARYGVPCGTASGMDNCGATRTASCSACVAPQACGGGGTAGQCGCVALGATSCLNAGAVCCAGNCSGTGRCCRALGDPCTGGISGECCQGTCDPGGSGTCCKPTGSCIDDAQCCSGACDQTENKCVDL